VDRGGGLVGGVISGGGSGGGKVMREGLKSGDWEEGVGGLKKRSRRRCFKSKANTDLEELDQNTRLYLGEDGG